MAGEGQDTASCPRWCRCSFGGVSCNVEDGSCPCVLPGKDMYLSLPQRRLAMCPARSRTLMLHPRTCSTERKPPPTSLAQSIIRSRRRAHTEIQLDLQVATFGKSELFPESNSSNPLYCCRDRARGRRSLPLARNWRRAPYSVPIG
jgi:hypothetical protein